MVVVLWRVVEVVVVVVLVVVVDVTMAVIVIMLGDGCGDWAGCISTVL